MATLTRQSTSKCVLVIESDTGTCRVCEDILKSSGHQVQIAHTASQSLDSLDRTKADVIVCDLDTACDMLPELVADPRFFDVKTRCIGVYSVLDHDQLQTAVELGAEDLIRKPFSATELLERIDSFSRY